MATVQVKLNVYRIVKTNETLGPFGIYHTTIEVHGVEYEYGGKDNHTGVWRCKSGHSVVMGDVVKQGALVAQIDLGTTTATQQQTENVMGYVLSEMPYYSALRSNCNHFSEYASAILCGSSRKFNPSKYNRMASLLSTFF